jgi:hypothetical protein
MLNDGFTLLTLGSRLTSLYNNVKTVVQVHLATFAVPAWTGQLTN